MTTLKPLAIHSCLRAFLALPALTLLVACSGGGGGTASPVIPPTPVTDVYVAGTQNIGGMDIATYWLNGKPVKLGDDTVSTQASAITVSDGNVYVAGVRRETSGDIAQYWVNGKAVPVGLGSATGIAVSGSDVYVVGGVSEQGIGLAKLWKNGMGSTLAVPDGQAVATGIALAGSDIVIPGYTYSNNSYFATCWKNGQHSFLSGGQGMALSATAKGSEVALGGMTWRGDPAQMFVTVWKSDLSAHDLFAFNGYQASVPSVAILGDKVLAAGTILIDSNTTKGFFWDGSTQQDVGSSIRGMALAGSDVYLVGHDAVLTPTVWKNGHPTPLPLLDGAKAAYPAAICTYVH